MSKVDSDVGSQIISAKPRVSGLLMLFCSLICGTAQAARKVRVGIFQVKPIIFNDSNILSDCPHISVIIPVFNAVATVERSVAGIQAQTCEDIELILVDDGSTDGTGRLLKSLERTDSRIRLITRPHTGIVDALNAGLAVARGDFVARMDADDTCPPERLERQSAALRSDPSIGVVSGRVEFAGDAENSRGFALYVDWLNSVNSSAEIATNRFVESPLAHPSVMFRRELVDQYGGYRQGDFPEDYELWLRWLEAGVTMEKIPETVLFWHDLSGRLTRTDPRYAQSAIFKLKAEFLTRWLVGRNSRHPEVIIWGAGRETRKRAEFLVRRGVRITHYIDIDPRKIGQVIHGRPVLAVEDLPVLGDCFILAYVSRRGAREDTRQRLANRGLKEGVHFMCCA